MTIINPVGLPGNRVSTTDFVTDASDLLWKPGAVAETINFDGEVFNYSHAIREGDDWTTAWYYVSPSGRAITVYND